MGTAGGIRTRLRRGLAVALVLVCVALALRAGGWFGGPVEAMEPAGVVTDDAGDGLATTTFDGPMVRKRAAIAIHPAKGADRAQIASELRAAAAAAGVGTLTDATFAVFSAQMLEYLVPEMTFVLPEGTAVADGEAFMRDHQPRTVAFYLVEPVVVHDLTFGVVPAPGVDPADVLARVDREGILADSLNHYVPTVQKSGLTVRYFGAVLSDGRILAVREALGRAAGVPAERVAVSANLPGPGVDLSQGLPNLVEGPRPHHG
ncbi:hypothetical protein [Couchioplanes azureus]|uniref:hypothetical protein n=1 Tax=Couchioplanes caeruleus TaxID=56438 RepID=UPI0016700CC1|nr:hypothetical protein [Couchioplanes caeruleus]GGQ49899.1 hypothetical protein GCM10010166_17990 [Couchioplanes caeruleus subsp. azureus]